MPFSIHQHSPTRIHQGLIYEFLDTQYCSTFLCLPSVYYVPHLWAYVLLSFSTLPRPDQCPVHIAMNIFLHFVRIFCCSYYGTTQAMFGRKYILINLLNWNPKPIWWQQGVVSNISSSFQIILVANNYHIGLMCQQCMRLIATSQWPS